MPTMQELNDWKFRSEYLIGAAKNYEACARECIAEAKKYRKMAADIAARINITTPLRSGGAAIEQQPESK